MIYKIGELMNELEATYEYLDQLLDELELDNRNASVIPKVDRVQQVIYTLEEQIKAA